MQDDAINLPLLLQPRRCIAVPFGRREACFAQPRPHPTEPTTLLKDIDDTPPSHRGQEDW
jgi:hypothetical protein